MQLKGFDYVTFRVTPFRRRISKNKRFSVEFKAKMETSLCYWQRNFRDTRKETINSRNLRNEKDFYNQC